MRRRQGSDRPIQFGMCSVVRVVAWSDPCRATGRLGMSGRGSRRIERATARRSSRRSRESASQWADGEGGSDGDGESSNARLLCSARDCRENPPWLRKLLCCSLRVLAATHTHTQTSPPAASRQPPAATDGGLQGPSSRTTAAGAAISSSTMAHAACPCLLGRPLPAARRLPAYIL